MKVLLTSKPSGKAKEMLPRVALTLKAAGIQTVSSAEKADFILSLGGDGTLLHKIRRFIEYGKPFAGINAGSVGFLCYFQPEQLSDVKGLDAAETEEFNAFVVTTGKIKDFAIQDIRVERVDQSTLKMRVKEGQTVLAKRQNGDGLIITNALGSTGYNASAGGPVLELSDKGVLVTPICPIRPDNIFYDSFIESKYFKDIDLELVCEKKARLVLDDRAYTIPANMPVRIKKAKKSYRLAVRRRDVYKK
jgi:NAD+ kinase